MGDFLYTTLQTLHNTRKTVLYAPCAHCPQLFLNAKMQKCKNAKMQKINHSKIKTFRVMNFKWNTIKQILQVVATVITAILGSLAVQSCM